MTRPQFLIRSAMQAAMTVLIVWTLAPSTQAQGTNEGKRGPGSNSDRVSPSTSPDYGPPSQAEQGVVKTAGAGRATRPGPAAGPASQKKEKRSKVETASDGAAHESPPDSEHTVVILADKQSENGDIVTGEGYVNATWGKLRVQSDRLTYNKVTGDLLAEGNVIYDSGPDERITARRAEINTVSRRGTFWNSTGFTDRTATREYLYFTADRVVKTGDSTYELYNATVTACDDVVPKWSFHSRQAELKIDDRVKLHNSVLSIRGIPILFLPYTWVPATKKERKSGFLIPATGNSSTKGRTFRESYFQTLGDSADLTLRTDYYSQRGIGLGAAFRARTDDQNSFVRIGLFTVVDRLFGAAGPNQGGTAIFGTGVQYLPDNWVAVGNVSLVSNLTFRQVFSDDLAQIINPQTESQFFLNNNTGSYNFNLLLQNQSTTIFQPFKVPSTGTDNDVTLRGAPEIDFGQFDRRLFSNVPIYLSFDTSFSALSRQEVVSGTKVLVTPAAVQRFDVAPKITVPLATVAGIAFTPSLTLSGTYYGNSINTGIAPYDPNLFAANGSDPRLDPTSSSYVPGLKVFDPATMNRISDNGLFRHYAEFDLDIRPPALEKDYNYKDGSRRFRHVIEPYITYRVITGIGQDYNKIILFDDRDAIANTNEIEYAVVNRFFVTKAASDIIRRRHRIQRLQEMTPENPETTQGAAAEEAPAKTPAGKQQATTTQPQSPQTQPPQAQQQGQPQQGEAGQTQGQEQTKEKQAQGQQQAGATKQGEQAAKGETSKGKLETGESTELGHRRDQQVITHREQRRAEVREQQQQGEVTEQSAIAATDEAVTEAYEFLTIKVAQKYFFDRNFGGAFVPGQRNQFFPVDTLSGFTFGGVQRSFSPLNLDVRYRPLATVFADLKMDVGASGEGIRDLGVSGGARKGNLSFAAEWFLSRQIKLQANSFEPGTFTGNQLYAAIQFGDPLRGIYAGTRIGYDFTDHFLTPTTISRGRFTTSRTFVGYGWDCCGIQFNYTTFNAGIRNENQFTITFTLAGIGTFGTDQFNQQGSRGRRRGAGGPDQLLP